MAEHWMEFLQSGFTMVQIMWGPVDSSAGLKSLYYKYVRTQYLFRNICHTVNGSYSEGKMKEHVTHIFMACQYNCNSSLVVANNAHGLRKHDMATSTGIMSDIL
jgi:hypothetical protein